MVQRDKHSRKVKVYSHLKYLPLTNALSAGTKRVLVTVPDRGVAHTLEISMVQTKFTSCLHLRHLKLSSYLNNLRKTVLFCSLALRNYSGMQNLFPQVAHQETVRHRGEGDCRQQSLLLSSYAGDKAPVLKTGLSCQFMSPLVSTWLRLSSNFLLPPM